MKKIVLIVSMLFGLAGLTMAQTAPAKDTKKAKTTTATKAPTATAKTTTATSATPAAGPTKKDGTPDMRYKVNKDAAKTPPVHTKKDGTPDMRYKENKKPATTPKKTS